MNGCCHQNGPGALWKVLLYMQFLVYILHTKDIFNFQGTFGWLAKSPTSPPALFGRTTSADQMLIHIIFILNLLMTMLDEHTNMYVNQINSHFPCNFLLP